MGKIDELIEKLCPNGVEYKELQDVCEFNRGTSITSKSVKNGNVPVISGGQQPAFYHNISNRPPNTITIAGSGAYAGYVSFWDRPIFCADAFSVDIKNEKLLNVKYLYHYLLNNQKKIYSKKSGVGIPHIYGKNIAKFKIPVPPLEIQNEIVRILDDFTELSAELTAELSAELKARQKQYEYYYNKVIDFYCNDDYIEMEQLFPNIRNGFVGTVTPYFTSKDNGIRYIEGTNIHNGMISDNETVYVTKDFHEKHIRNELKADDILMVQSGHVGECAVVGEKYKGCNCHALIIMSNGGKCDSNFIKYYLNSPKGKRELARITTGGTVKHILASKMKKFKVPNIYLEEQKNIVKILNKFEKLCNDISEGLPAEIEARQKQYEYYRDKLLNFKELKVS